MIHTREYEAELFEALASGRKSFVEMENDPELLVGDFLAINEVQEVAYTLSKPSDPTPKDYPFIEATGRCCLMEVTYIEMADENTVMLASVRPCAITTTAMLKHNYTRDIYEVPTYNRNGEVTHL